MFEKHHNIKAPIPFLCLECCCCSDAVCPFPHFLLPVLRILNRQFWVESLTDVDKKGGNSPGYKH